ncbi:MAG: RNA-binding protein [Methanocellales archaeon]|nr:RNA-binding protein [Methanocellales archaeon]
MRIKTRHHLRDDIREKLVNQLKSTFGSEIEQLFTGKKFEIAETDDEYDIIFVDNEPVLFMIGEKVFPTVKGALKLKSKRNRVVVDVGAIRAISKGADVMCPGIVDADIEIQKGDFVIIVDEVHNKPLAIGRALISGEDMMGDKGKAIKSIHYVGDSMWKLEV